MRHSIYLIVLGLLFFASCYVAKPIIKVQPANEEDVIWELGDPLVSLTQDSIQMDIAFHRSSDQHIIFKTRFVNNSKRFIHIDPRNCNLEIFQPSSSKSRKGVVLYTMDPEDKILQQQMAVARQEAKVKNAGVWQIVDVASSIVTGVTVGGEDNTFNTENKLYYLREELINWSGELLRKTDLGPNFYVDGFLFFPRVESAKRLKLIFKIESYEFTINFEQQVQEVG